MCYGPPVMPKLRTFLALDSTDKIASIEAIAMVLYAKFLISGVPPRHWRARFAAHSIEAESLPDLETIRRVRFAIQRALANVPGSPNCLPQALAARWMLERRGIASRLFVGTQRGEDGQWLFHAWLKVGEEWVTGLCDESRYSLLEDSGAETA